LCNTEGREEGSIQNFREETLGKETTWNTQAQMVDNIKMYLRGVKWGTWTGSMWLKIGTGDGLF
jgi:hypothetical protein